MILSRFLRNKRDIFPSFWHDYKTRPASSSYGMLTGSVIICLVQTPTLSDNSLRFYQSLCIQ